jgi:long-chain acyl-CoA synthetase
MKERTIGKLLLKRVQLTAESNAIGWIESLEVKSLNFKTYKTMIEQLSLALLKHGLVVGDKLAILAQTCKEWHLLDMAGMCSRAVVVPIYPSYLGHEIKYIINHSETKILVIENDTQMDKIIPHLGEIKDLKLIIGLQDLNEETKKKFRNQIAYLSYKDLVKDGQEEIKTNPDLFEESIKQQ